MKEPIKLIDLNSELKLIKELIKTFFNGTDREWFDGYVEKVFKIGLEKGKYWIEEYPLFSLGYELNNTSELTFPIKARKAFLAKTNEYSDFDSLVVFNSFIDYEVKKIRDYQVAYGSFDFSAEVNKMIKRLNLKRRTKSLSPRKDLSPVQQSAFVSVYKGFRAGSAGGFETPEKLTPAQMNHNKENNGRTYFESLTAAIFSHGLACAEKNNSIELVNTLFPVYEKFMFAPFNNNGDEILEMVKGNKFIQIAQLYAPIEFISMKEIMEEKALTKANKEKLANESQEEKKVRLKSESEFFEDMMNEIDVELKNEDNVKSKYAIVEAAIRKHELTAVDIPAL